MNKYRMLWLTTDPPLPKGTSNDRGYLQSRPNKLLSLLKKGAGKIWQMYLQLIKSIFFGGLARWCSSLSHCLWRSHPYVHWLKSQPLHLQSSSLTTCLGNRGRRPNAWSLSAWETQTKLQASDRLLQSLWDSISGCKSSVSSSCCVNLSTKNT